MKPFHIVLAVVGGSIVATVGGFLFADCANAQTIEPRPNVILPPTLESGTYPMKVTVPTQDVSDNDVFEACCDRVDVDPIIRLGCNARSETTMTIEFDVEVIKTPGDDAEVRCYTVNTQEQSDYTSNSYILPFPRKPNQPFVQ